MGGAHPHGSAIGVAVGDLASQQHREYSSCDQFWSRAAAAHGGDALERIDRLLQPPAPLACRRRLAIAGTLALLVGAPVLLAAFGLPFPALAACLPVPAA